MGFFRRLFGKTSDEAENKTVSNTSTVEALPNSRPAGVEFDPIAKPVATSPLPSRNISDGVTRPLVPDKAFPNPDEPYASHGEHLAFGQYTDVGRVRSNNQDAALSFFVSGRSAEAHPDFGLFIVADGMGGHHDGEKASAITTRVMATQVANTVYLPSLMVDNDVERATITEAMISAVQKANQEVKKNVPEGGTTVTAVAVIGDLAHFVHVGDSRAYLVTKEGLEQVTRDHSLVQRLIELGQLTKEEANDHPQKNVLYRALGQNDSVEVDTLTRRLPSNCRLLLCSDGLWSQVEERDLFEITMNTPDPQQACEKLVALANARGGTDNITAIILKIS